jgi:hypothetical protein
MFEDCLSLCLARLSVVQSTYSRNTSGETYFPDKCATRNQYYQALRFNISVSGTYEFSSESSMETYGYLYRDTFDPVDPSRNLIANSNSSCANQQFWLQPFLQANSTYILLVTTLHANMTGALSVMSQGVANVSFTRLGEYESCPSTVLRTDGIDTSE